MKTLLTIAIPIYNAMPYLKYAVQSIINQTYKNWILYLIDDGSTDGSIDSINKYIENDSRINIICDHCNKGLVERLNQSIAMTNTKYYARMDADDIMYITRLEEQVNYLESHPEVDVVGSSIMTIDDKNNIMGSGLSVGRVSGFIHPTVMGRTAWFKANPYSSWAVRAEDFELWCRTSMQSNFHAIEKPLLFYREFGMPSFNKTRQSLLTSFKIYKNYRQYGKTIIWCVKGISITVIKLGAYTLFNSVGKMDYIVRNRKRKPIPMECCLNEDDLKISIAGLE